MQQPVWSRMLTCRRWQSLQLLQRRSSAKPAHPFLAAQRARCTSCSSPAASWLMESTVVREWRYDFLPDGVLTAEALAWAASCIATLNNPPIGSKLAFYDRSGSACVLCGGRLEGGYRAHMTSYEHLARVEVITRTLGLLYTFCNQATGTDPRVYVQAQSRPDDDGGGPVSAAASAGRSRRFAAAHVQASHRRSPVNPVSVTQSCYHIAHVRSPWFDEEGVPSHETLFHNPEKLREVDLISVTAKRWWRMLHQTPPSKGGLTFRRILSLSSDDMAMRLHRLRYLLFFLQTRGVLRSSLTTRNRAEGGSKTTTIAKSVNRDAAFERYEVIGDGVFKSVVPPRMHTMLPADEGGVTMEMRLIERILDSNHSLLDIYNYLELDDLLSAALANNKVKADVVEALVGELQALVWSTEVVYNTDAYQLPAERANSVYLHTLVEHTLNELEHVVFMWRIDSTLRNAKSLMESLLNEEFLEKRGRRSSHRHSHDRASEVSDAELTAKAPRNAIQPLLLSWERRHNGVRTAKEEAGLVTGVRCAARPQAVFQDAARRLATQPAELPDTARRAVVLGKDRRLAMLQKQHTDADVLKCVAASRTLPTPLSAQSEPLLHLDLRASPTTRQTPRPTSADLEELVGGNCVIIKEAPSASSDDVQRSNRPSAAGIKRECERV